MKIVNEKGKLFGIINLVDLLVLLLVIAVVAVVGIKLFGTKAVEVVSSKSDCYAEVEIIAANPRLYNEVERKKDDMIGARMVSGNEYVNSTIEDVWYEPYISVAPDSTGTAVASVDPSRLNVVFLIKCQVSPESATFTIGAQEVRAGRAFTVKTQTFENNGTIRYVNVGEYDGAGRANEITLEEFNAGL